jgi:hypothetical protein
MFARLDKHRKLSERTRMYYYDGESVDEKTRNTFKKIVKGNFDTESFIEYGPIIARPDLVDNDRKTVIELKTTDPSAIGYKETPKGMVKVTEREFIPKQHNLRQLRGYMSILDYEDGVLWYHIITRKLKHGLWKEYHVKMNSTERSEMRNFLLARALLWEKAYDERNPYLLPGVQDDDALNWMCRGNWDEETKQYEYCPYVEQCTEGWAYREQYFKDHPSAKQVNKPEDLKTQLEKSVEMTRSKSIADLHKKYS